jgi:chemotaxis protein MotB
MGRAEKKPDPIKEEGAPEWMVTFSDCMTLLLTFFVLLLSFSSFDDVGEIAQLGSVFAEEFSIDTKITRERDALLLAMLNGRELKKGSEKPVLEAVAGDHSKKETLSTEHRHRKIFLLSSDKIFWGKGAALSSSGKIILSDMASFLKDMPNRIVVSENGRRMENGDEALGLQRAWAVIDYLSTVGALDKQRISLSAAGTVVKEENAGGQQEDRTLEIVLLEGSICN